MNEYRFVFVCVVLVFSHPHLLKISDIESFLTCGFLVCVSSCFSVKRAPSTLTPTWKTFKAVQQALQKWERVKFWHIVAQHTAYCKNCHKDVLYYQHFFVIESLRRVYPCQTNVVVVLHAQSAHNISCRTACCSENLYLTFPSTLIFKCNMLSLSAWA